MQGTLASSLATRRLPTQQTVPYYHVGPTSGMQTGKTLADTRANVQAVSLGSGGLRNILDRFRTVGFDEAWF